MGAGHLCPGENEHPQLCRFADTATCARDLMQPPAVHPQSTAKPLASSAKPAAESPIQFTFQPIDFKLDSDETPERHAPETMAGGVAVFDYNNDGKLDIFFTNGADIKTLQKNSAKYSNRLFENDGHGHFTDVTAKAGLAGTGYDNGVAIGDYDNDGYEDIFVAGVYRNTLYHNNGNGTFTDVTAKAGLNKPDPEYGPLWSVGAAWVDVNNDGLLDLVVINYLKWDCDHEPVCQGYGHRDYCHPKMYKPTPNQLFLNNGDGTFRDASVEAGFRAHPGKGMGVAAADFEPFGPDGSLRHQRQADEFVLSQQGRRASLRKLGSTRMWRCGKTGHSFPAWAWISAISITTAIPTSSWLRSITKRFRSTGTPGKEASSK